MNAKRRLSGYVVGFEKDIAHAFGVGHATKEEAMKDLWREYERRPSIFKDSTNRNAWEAAQRRRR